MRNPFKCTKPDVFRGELAKPGCLLAEIEPGGSKIGENQSHSKIYYQYFYHDEYYEYVP